ncbi:MAG: hypothetical protein PG978_000659 [Wolbachia endosymbiont of Ctenocephalides felis wCfeF]|nr:MAG: hypothetical protein PG978_000659 [Wolbachia endosymbiont of Ctenocephalides felis wCfeF]
MFSVKDREKFNKSLDELLENSFKNINKIDEKGRTILHYAAGISDEQIVKLLIEKGIADVNAKDTNGHTPLHLAIAERRLANVRELIRSGADVNAEEYGNKCTPLHLACMIGEVGVVKELVKAGAETERNDKSGLTAMDYARNNKEIMEVLDNNIAKKQGEFLEKIRERTAVSVIKKSDKELEEKG